MKNNLALGTAIEWKPASKYLVCSNDQKVRSGRLGSRAAAIVSSIHIVETAPLLHVGI